MTEEEQQKVVAMVTEELIGICKVNLVDFYSLDANMRDILVQVFQAGVGFMEKIREEARNNQ